MVVKAKKKVLFIITKSVWGGAQKYVYDLATSLPNDKFDVAVAAGGEGILTKKLKDAGIPFHTIKNFQRDINVFKELKAYFELLSLYLKLKPDVIHANSSKAAGIAGAAAWDYMILTFNFKVKKIFTAHGWGFHEKRPKWQTILIKIFSLISSIYFDKIICVSEYDKASAIKNKIAGSKKLTVIHNGIKKSDYDFYSREKARAIIKETAGMENNGFWIGTIGEFTKNKGQRFLINAISKMPNQNIKTIIIGWGEEKQNLQSQIEKLRLQNQVFLINDLKNPANYLMAFDAFVLPSLKEGFPYVILEAGLAGVPVAASKTGGIPEIIDAQTGILTEPGDEKTLFKAIEKLLNDDQSRKKFGNAIKEKIENNFNFEKMLSSTITAYE